MDGQHLGGGSRAEAIAWKHDRNAKDTLGLLTRTKFATRFPGPKGTGLYRPNEEATEDNSVHGVLLRRNRLEERRLP